MKPNEITGAVIGAAIEVHRELGPDKKEAAYERALCWELGLRGIPHRAQVPVPVVYKGVKLDCGYRLDVLAMDIVVTEAKSVELLHPIHKAQVLTHLRLGGWQLGLLINFNVAVLKNGISRLVLGLEEHGLKKAETRRAQRRERPVAMRRRSVSRARYWTQRWKCTVCLDLVCSRRLMKPAFATSCHSVAWALSGTKGWRLPTKVNHSWSPMRWNSSRRAVSR